MLFLFQKDAKAMMDAFFANGCTDGASDGEHDAHDHDPSKCRERGQWDNDCRAQEDSASCADDYHRVCVHGCASVGLFRTPLIPSVLCSFCCPIDVKRVTPDHVYCL